MNRENLQSGGIVIPGYRIFGWGRKRVIVLHDWISDGSSYDPMLPYLDPDLATWAFMDLRGYGLSRYIPGNYSLGEATDDVLALANSLGWQDFHLVGHSMSGMIVQHVAAIEPNRVLSIIGIAPVSAYGQQLTSAEKRGLKTMVDDDSRRNGLNAIWGNRLSNAWLSYKVRRWRETSDHAACASYVDMFSGPGFAHALAGFNQPVRVVVGANDVGPFTEENLRKSFSSVFSDINFRTLSDAGHYPMQETPVLLASIMEQFIRGMTAD